MGCKFYVWGLSRLEVGGGGREGFWNGRWLLDVGEIRQSDCMYYFHRVHDLWLKLTSGA